MNWWTQLKSWQKLGIIFAAGHFILIGLFFATLHGDALMLVVLMDLPLVSLASYSFGRLYYNSEFFAITYHLLFGSVIYGLIGAIAGSLFDWLKSFRNKT